MCALKNIKLVVSDLHVGEKSDLDLFDKEDDFISFLNHYNSYSNVELIFNGDFIDFLKIEPLGGNSRIASEDKLNRVTQARPNLFEALSEFVNKDENHITIIAGNHDIDLIHPNVQKKLRSVINEDNKKIQFVTDKCYFKDGILFEHGNQYDYFNRIDYKHLLMDERSGAINLPLGSKFVYQLFNHIDHGYPFINRITSNWLGAVLLWILDKDLFFKCCFHGTFDIAKTEIESKIFKSRVEEAVRSVSDTQILSGSLSSHLSSSDDYANYLVNEFAEIFIGEGFLESGESEMSELLTFLHYPDPFTLGLNDLNAVSKYIKGALRWVKSPRLNYTIDQIRKNGQNSEIVSEKKLEQQRKSVATIRQQIGNIKPNILICGHTHQMASIVLDDGFKYVNTGSWSQNAKFFNIPEDDAKREVLLEWLKGLGDGDNVYYYSYPSFVEIVPFSGDHPPEARLYYWDGKSKHEILNGD